MVSNFGWNLNQLPTIFQYCLSFKSPGVSKEHNMVAKFLFCMRPSRRDNLNCIGYPVQTIKTYFIFATRYRTLSLVLVGQISQINYSVSISHPGSAASSCSSPVLVSRSRSGIFHLYFKHGSGTFPRSSPYFSISRFSHRHYPFQTGILHQAQDGSSPVSSSSSRLDNGNVVCRC